MKKKDITRKEIENTRHTVADLAMVCKRLGYGISGFDQLLFSNGASATNLFEFFDDNPGAVEAVLEFILENASSYDGFNDDDDDDEDYDDEVPEGSCMRCWNEGEHDGDCVYAE